MKAIIIEDENQAIVALKSELSIHCPDITIIGTATSIKRALKLIEKESPELVFLDIQLKDGTGFDFLDALTEYNFKIIFTTAYSEYALNAIKVSAIDYLLKPIDSDELIEAVNKAKKNSLRGEHYNKEKEVKNVKVNILTKKIAIQTSKGISLYELDSILRLQSESNYTAIYYSNGKKEIVAKILREFEKSLFDSGFVRIHNSHIINLNHLKSYINKDGGYVILSDKTTIPVSKRKKSTLLGLLNNLH